MDMTAENRSRDGGNVWMIVLIALALIATVIMLFSDSAVWLQIALLAALWAAICGFLLVTRTRNDRDRARAELDAREREYRAELDALRARNVADRNALEAARAGEGLPPAVDTEVLREIRAELATLRAQLEDLSGREFGYEPAALQAEARRVKEIEARASRVAPQQPTPQPQPTPQSQPQPAQPAHQLQHEQPAPQPQQRPQQPAQPAPEPTRQQQPQPQPQQAQPQPAPAPEWPKQWPEQPQHGESTRWGAPNENEVTSRITPVRDADEKQAINALTKQPGQQQAPQQPQPQHEQQAPHEQQPAPHVHRGPSSDAVAGRVGSHRAPEGRNPLTDLIRERQEELDRERAERELQQRQEQEAQQRREREARERAERERREEEARRAEEARIAEQERREEEARRREAELEAESRGRRRADENRDGALTVAELLARSKKGR